MTMPPMLMYLNIAPPERASVRVWLPLFLLWPLVILLLALPLLVAVIADFALWMAGRSYHHYSVLILRVLGLLGEMRGMVIRIQDGETAVDMTVY